jgi:hypothetical protein
VTEARTDGVSAGAGLRYSDGIAGARTLIALEGNATALQHRFPNCLELAPYAGDDLRGNRSEAPMLMPLEKSTSR